MKRLVLGVAGHVDHGKTALVGALTGMETDRLPEEKRRGMSIALGFAHAEIGGAQVDFVDAPGHERFVRTLVGGVTGVDAVLMVVAANEGVKPQTREHLTIAALLGLASIIIVVSKCDLADPARIGVVGEAAARLARELGFRPAAAIATSSATGEGLQALRSAIGALAQGSSPPADDGFAFLPIDRAFLIPGQGVVATGTLRRGALRTDHALELQPGGAPVNVRRLHVHGRPVASAEPGQRVAVNLRGAELAEVRRGAVLSEPGALTGSDWLTVALRAAPGAPRLSNGARVELLVGTAAVGATVRLLEGDGLDPGDQALAQLHTSSPVAAPAREPFILRLASPALTVGGGQVIDPVSRRLRRQEVGMIEHLRRLSEAQPMQRIERVLEHAAASGVGLDRLAHLSGWSSAKATAAVQQLGGSILKPGIAVWGPAFARAQKAVLAALEAAPHPLSRIELAHCAPGLGGEVLDAALAAAASGGKLRAEGGRFAILRPNEERARAEAAAALAHRLALALRDGGLSPPDLAESRRRPEGRRAIEALVREGLAVRTLDRVQKREILFHASAVEGARRLLSARLAPPGLSVSEAGQILGVSRKYSVPLLEHLDAIGFTRRCGDRRVLAEALRSVTRG